MLFKTSAVSIYSNLIFISIISCLIFISCDKQDFTSSKVTVNNSPSEGQIFLSPFTAGTSAGRLLTLNKNGNTIREKVTNSQVMNLKKWVINGITRYTWLTEVPEGFHIPGFTSYTPGYYVIADDNFSEIRRVYLQPTPELDVSSQNMLDLHDFILISDDHYITQAYYLKTVTNIPAILNPVAGVKVITPVIQEINNAVVTWQWVGTDHEELYAESVQGNVFSDAGTAQDYLHLNSMAIDPRDNNLVCSFRNADLVMKINRASGDIMWKLGGKNSDFPLLPNMKFLRQHHATFIDNGNTILLFDNGLKAVRETSRILEFQLDEAAHTIMSFKSFDIPEPWAQFMGSVQKIGSRYFIGGGSGKYILEIEPATGEKKFEMTLSENSYRTIKE